MLWSTGDYNRFFDPFEGIRQFQDQVNRLFERGAFAETADYPLANLWVGTDSAVLTAELPGVNPKEIDIGVRGDVLTIKGERKAPELSEGEHYVRHERRGTAFERSVELPFPVNANAVEAKYELGILKITLPRAEEDKPRKIAIK